MFLGALANYFLSLARTVRGNNHDLEPGGQVLITIGMIMMLIDIYKFDPATDAAPEDWHFINPFYLGRTRWQSILADLVTFLLTIDCLRGVIRDVPIFSIHC